MNWLNTGNNHIIAGAAFVAVLGALVWVMTANPPII